MVGTTASNFDVYHQRREEFHERGSFEYDNYGVHFWFDNVLGLLTYFLANEMFERSMCTATFEVWEIQGRGARSVSYGQIVWSPMVGTNAMGAGK